MRKILYIGLMMCILIGCSQSATAPSDFKITLPADATVSLSNAFGTRVCYQDIIATVTDVNSKPRNGLVVSVYGQSTFGSFYSDNTLGTALTSPYTTKTDSEGKISVNYCSAAFTCSATADLSATFGIRVQGGTISGERTTTVTIKTCGT